MGNIVKLCNKNKLELIEDSAETLGATWNKRYTGSFGLGCFSFSQLKILRLLREILTTNDKKGAGIKKLIAHGINKDKEIFYWNRVRFTRS